MALCMNCNIALNTNQQYEYKALSMSPEIVTIIEQWIAQEITDEDHICQECFNLLLIELNNRNKLNIGDRQLGHVSVCVCCGLSISRRTGRRSRPLSVGHPERDYIASIIIPRQIHTNARACNACWQRARSNINKTMEQTREAQIIDDNVENRSSSDTESENSVSSEIDINIDNIGKNMNKFVELNGYSRTPDTPTHCFVPQCTNSERLRVPIFLKKHILMYYKLYVTQSARFCKEHASVHDWELLNEFQFTTQFTSKHVVEMLDLLRIKHN